MKGASAGEDDAPALVVLDASTIINAIHANAWRNLLQLRGFLWSTPKVVVRQVEVKHSRRKPIRDAVESGSLRLLDEPIPPSLLDLFVDAARRFGQQDAAVLVNALVVEAGIAADDRSLCNEARRQGVRLVLGTEDLFAATIREGLVSLAQGNRKLRSLRDARYEPRVACLCAMTGFPCSCRGT